VLLPVGRWTRTSGEAKAPMFLRGHLTRTQNKQGKAAGDLVPGVAVGEQGPTKGVAASTTHSGETQEGRRLVFLCT